MQGSVVSKSDFARLQNVTPTRVGQWIREGKITAEALDGEGRFARIRVDVARRQIGDRSDVGQMSGNGARTPISSDAPIANEDLPRTDSVVEAIRREKLRQIQFNTRDLAERELARRGLYIPTASAAAALGKTAGEMVMIFEGALADFASALSAKFQIPQRDALHLLRTEFRDVRSRAAKAVRSGAAALPGLLLDEVPEDLPDDPAGAP